MKAGARNQIVGKVVGVEKGMIMAKATVKIPAGATMTSVMTVDSVKDLRLKKGDKVTVVVKAIHVLLIKE
jgi:molybdopterin-binding protein